MSFNGKLPAASLVQVQPDCYLETDTAHAWQRLAHAAARDGISVWITLGGGYRDIEAQRRLVAAGSASGIRVAPVGTQTHGWGDRVDVGSFGVKYGAAGAARANWLHDHADEYGFSFEFGAADPNHLRFTGQPLTPVTPPTTKEDDTMQIRLGDGEGRYGPKNTIYWALTGQAWAPSTDRPMADRISVYLGKPWYDCEYYEWEYFKATAPGQASAGGAAIDYNRIATPEQVAAIPAPIIAAIPTAAENAIAVDNLSKQAGH